jgi:hypothetical protein
MAEDKPTPAGTKPESDEAAAKKPSPLRWIAGWVVVPGVVLGSIFGAGVHLGANHPEGWYTRAVLWVAGLF